MNKLQLPQTTEDKKYNFFDWVVFILFYGLGLSSSILIGVCIGYVIGQFLK